MFNELLIVIVYVVVSSCSIIISCSIVHYGLKVQIWTGATPKSTPSGIAVMLHVLILIPDGHCLVHHGDLLQVEVVPCLTRDARGCRTLLFASSFTTRHVMLVMMEVGSCVMLLADLHIVVLLC